MHLKSSYTHIHTVLKNAPPTMMPYHGQLDCYYSMFCVERKHKAVATLCIASYVWSH